MGISGSSKKTKKVGIDCIIDKKISNGYGGLGGLIQDYEKMLSTTSTTKKHI